MTVRRLFAIMGIFLLGCTGWAVLGTTTLLRSNQLSMRLGEEVGSLWGNPIVQGAPSFTLESGTNTSGAWAPTNAEEHATLMPAASDVEVDLTLEYRKKGLIWYPTYVTYFDGTYAVENPTMIPQTVRAHFVFPANHATYDRVSVELDGAALDTRLDVREGVFTDIALGPQERRALRVTYQTRGLGEWRYRPDGQSGQVKNLDILVRTNFHNVDFPEDAISPMAIQQSDEGMALTWRAANLLTSQDLGVTMPDKLNPGPLSGRITFFAPVCLFFFFLLVATIGILRRVAIHPMHYLFVTGGFFAFHLLFAYLVDHIPVHGAFAIAAATSVTLVTGYLRAALGPRFPWRLGAAGQVFYLVLFSYSFFLRGTTGLTVTLGAVATLAMLMWVTARIDWTATFARSPKPEVAPHASR